MLKGICVAVIAALHTFDTPEHSGARSEVNALAVDNEVRSLTVYGSRLRLACQRGWLYSAQGDNCCGVWDMGAGKLLTELRGHEGS